MNRNNNEKNAKVFRVALKCAALFAWIYLIFGFSSDTGAESSQKSGSLLISIVNLLFPSLGANMDNYQNMAALENSEKILRKLAHMFEYGVLAFLVLILLYEVTGYIKLIRSNRYIKFIGSNRYINAYTVSEFLVLLVGSIDEINQLQTPGRYGSPVDVLVDGLGGAIVLALFFLTHRKTT